MRYTDLPHYLKSQFAEACRVHQSLQDAELARQRWAGSLYWRLLNGLEQLIRADAAGRRRRLGARSAQTEAIYAEFIASRQQARVQHRHLLEAMKQQQRVNKVLRVGHVPLSWIRILNGIRAAGLAADVRVVGAAATYAYESLAGVRIGEMPGDAGARAWLSERRQRLQLAVAGAAQALHLLAVIEHVAPAFQRDSGRGYVAVDRRGPEVEVLVGGTDMCAAHGASAEAYCGLRRLLDAPVLRQTVAGVNGEMAVMMTVDPRLYVLHRLSLANQPGRDGLQRSLDVQLARVVIAIVRERIASSGPEAAVNGGGKRWLANLTTISA